MNAISLLIEPMLVGFLTVATLHVSRYWVIRQTGYVFLLPILIVGMVLMHVVDAGLTALSQFLDSDRISPNTTFWAAALAILIPLVANAVIGRGRSVRLAGAWRGSLTECLLQDSIDSGSFVELTLETGKSYVGLVLKSGITTPSESDVSIVPIFSGYRDDEHQLQLTTSYLDAISKAPKEDDVLYQFELVLSKSQIVSARRFDVEIFEAEFGRPLPESTPTNSAN